MGELTAGVAHEVRNPLGIIRASVQLVEDAHGDGARVREATGIIKQEIDRLDRVIKALLDFGRPSAPTLRPTNVEDVVTDVVLFTRRFAGQARVEIETEYAAGLPLVSADADQLKQVLVNLVSNAVQAMERTGGSIKVRVWDDDGFVFMSIADTGRGITPEELERIFDPFYSTRDDGTGLGLTIVHRIIDQHGGRIEVESEADVGTTFTVALPAALAGKDA
jgi:signal transduction histidine kinase